MIVCTHRLLVAQSMQTAEPVDLYTVFYRPCTDMFNSHDVEWVKSATTSQPPSISHPAEDRRLSWVGRWSLTNTAPDVEQLCRCAQVKPWHAVSTWTEREPCESASKLLRMWSMTRARDDVISACDVISPIVRCAAAARSNHVTQSQSATTWSMVPTNRLVSLPTSFTSSAVANARFIACWIFKSTVTRDDEIMEICRLSQQRWMCSPSSLLAIKYHLHVSLHVTIYSKIYYYKII